MSPGRFWLASLTVVVLTKPAFAGDADCNYIEIAATKSEKPAVDPDLKPLEKKFKKAPFSAWNTFKKLASGAVSLTRNKPDTVKLKQGSLTLMLRDRTEKRLGLTVSMEGADGKRVLEAKPAFKAGDWLMLGGTGDKDDAGHILALTCK